MLSELNQTAQRLLAESAFDVAWVERDDRRRGIVVAPLSVAAPCATHLYDERTVVATSATLALGGSFDTVARSLGLPPHASRTQPSRSLDEDGEEVELPWRSLDVGSPFDYRRQGILYVAAHLPRPAASGLPDAGGRGAGPAGDARSVAVPSGSSPPAAPPNGPARCCGHGPTWRSWSRARRRCRCW